MRSRFSSTATRFNRFSGSRLSLEGSSISSLRFFGYDLLLLILVITITICGLVMVYDASVVQAVKDYGDKYAYIKQQLLWVILGFGAMGFFALFDYRYLKGFSLPMLLGSFILLLAVFIPGLGISAGGAHRWLRIAGFTIQPGEIIKLTSVIFFAAIFEKKKAFQQFGIIVLLIVFILGVLQKDLGSTIVFFLTAISVYLIADGPIIYFWMSIPMAFVGFLLFVFTSSYRLKRVMAFLDPFADPQGYTYHISQILIALGSGGLIGLGLGQSRQKFEYIPEVTTDSIFAIIGEEFGFFGSVFIICLLSALVYRGFRISQRCNDRFGSILAFGLTIWLGSQTAVNLASMVSLVPLTGVPLPFISYGGSALLANLVAVGILLNISKEKR